MPAFATSVHARGAAFRQHLSVGRHAPGPCRGPVSAARAASTLRRSRAVHARAPPRKVVAHAHSDPGSEFGDHEPFHDLTAFERETQAVLTRVLTARATQLVLMQLNVGSPQIYEWLSQFTRECPPIEGDEFVLKLMKRQPYTSIDPATKNTMIIHPVTLAQQVLAARDELAEASAKGLAHHVKNANLDVIKTHLNQNHYTLSRKVTPTKKGSVGQRDGKAEAGHASG